MPAPIPTHDQLPDSGGKASKAKLHIKEKSGRLSPHEGQHSLPTMQRSYLPSALSGYQHTASIS